MKLRTIFDDATGRIVGELRRFNKVPDGGAIDAISGKFVTSYSPGGYQVISADGRLNWAATDIEDNPRELALRALMEYDLTLDHFPTLWQAGPPIDFIGFASAWRTASFGLRLSVLMALRDVSSRDLAVLSGISHAQICNLRNGNDSPKASTIVSLARGLNVKPSMLLGEQ